MNTLNHALWGTTIGRTVGMPVEGAIIASIPDLLTVPIFGYYLFKKKLKPNQSPESLRVGYEILHNWFFAGALSIILGVISKSLLILSLGYLWHVVEDAFLHKNMASRFLWPFWNGKIQLVSANGNKWIQVLDLFAIIGVNIYLFKVL